MVLAIAQIPSFSAVRPLARSSKTRRRERRPFAAGDGTPPACSPSRVDRALAALPTSSLNCPAAILRRATSRVIAAAGRPVATLRSATEATSDVGQPAIIEFRIPVVAAQTTNSVYRQPSREPVPPDPPVASARSGFRVGHSAQSLKQCGRETLCERLPRQTSNVAHHRLQRCPRRSLPCFVLLKALEQAASGRDCGHAPVSVT
jgi:hypothetical protein